MRQYLVSIALMGLTLAAAGAAGNSWRVQAASGAGHYAALGTVEAVRQGDLQAQVAGHITEVLVRSGESVRSGAPLLRIDARAAQALSAAADAQSAGAAAQLVQARAEYARAQKLRASDYISEAAMQRAEAQLRSLEAQAAAAAAQSRATGTQADWYVLRAPYDARITAVNVAVGDEAAPGRTLLQLYAPGAQRIVAQVPEAIARQLQPSAPALLQVDADGGNATTVTLKEWHRMPAVDAASRSVGIRAELPADLAVEPGRMLRLLLPTAVANRQLMIPASAVIRRSEVDAVYVLDANGAAHLRQVRLGRTEGAQVQVLAGLADGELIATDPQSAARTAGKP